MTKPDTTPKPSAVDPLAATGEQPRVDAPKAMDPAQRYEFEGDLSTSGMAAHVVGILRRDVPRTDWRVTASRLDDGRVRWTAVYEQGASFDPNSILLDEVERLHGIERERDDARRQRDEAARDIDELLRGTPHRTDAPEGDGLAATVQALCDVYRITQAGGAGRQRFYDAAIRGGELLAARLPPPAAG